MRRANDYLRAYALYDTPRALETASSHANVTLFAFIERGGGGPYSRPLVKSSVIQENSVIEALSRNLQAYHVCSSRMSLSFTKVLVRFWLHHSVF